VILLIGRLLVLIRKVHHRAVKNADILHRDISDGNILIDSSD
jgi:hypothetical protein